MRGEPYETSDAVFGVKQSLIVDWTPSMPLLKKEYGVKKDTLLLKNAFVLVRQKEVDELRDCNAMEAFPKLGLNMELVDLLPVLDSDCKESVSSWS